jgi:hypothetical protein
MNTWLQNWKKSFEIHNTGFTVVDLRITEIPNLARNRQNDRAAFKHGPFLHDIHRLKPVKTLHRFQFIPSSVRVLSRRIPSHRQYGTIAVI